MYYGIKAEYSEILVFAHMRTALWVNSNNFIFNLLNKCHLEFIAINVFYYCRYTARRLSEMRLMQVHRLAATGVLCEKKETAHRSW